MRARAARKSVWIERSACPFMALEFGTVGLVWCLRWSRWCAAGLVIAPSQSQCDIGDGPSLLPTGGPGWRSGRCPISALYESGSASIPVAVPARQGEYGFRSLRKRAGFHSHEPHFSIGERVIMLKIP